MSAPMADFGMDTAALAGPLEARLQAVKAAGFGQVTLSAEDLVGHPQGLDAAVAAVRASGLKVAALQALRDFEGLSGHLHGYKVEIAKQLIGMARAVGAQVLLVCSSTSPHASADVAVMARDLRKLGMLALPHGIRVAYSALSWGRHVSEVDQAWEVVEQADLPNLGLAVDAFHMLAASTSAKVLDWVAPEKVFLVQLADFLWPETRTAGERRETSRHARVFPGEGVHSQAIAELVLRLDAMGYRGGYSLEVFNDDCRQMPLPFVAQRAKASALWLAEGVLRRSVPLPGQMRLRLRGAA